MLVPSSSQGYREELFSRNSGLLNPGLQGAIKNSRVLLVGCGLGSQIAILAARTGFEKFTLCDGDTVQLSNLNRQVFEQDDLGRNKAEVTWEKILQINPFAQVEVCPGFVKAEGMIEALISRNDLIVNMADPDQAMYLINRKAKEQGKPVFFPLTFGFGGYLLVFSSSSPPLEEIVGGKIHGNEFFEMLVRNTVGDLVFMQVYQQAMKEHQFVPQLGISAYLTSVLVVKAMLRWTGDFQGPFAPIPILADPSLVSG